MNPDTLRAEFDGLAAQLDASIERDVSLDLSRALFCLDHLDQTPCAFPHARLVSEDADTVTYSASEWPEEIEAGEK